jgi:NCS1 family nucleobase:cation symporter-1
LFVTAFASVLTFPWESNGLVPLYEKWFMVLGTTLSPILGIMTTDFFFVHRQRIDTTQLDIAFGRYWYINGYNRFAFVALAVGILSVLPGILVSFGVFSIPALTIVFQFNWVIGLLVGGSVYTLLMRASVKEWAVLDDEVLEMTARCRGKSYSDFTSKLNF